MTLRKVRSQLSQMKYNHISEKIPPEDLVFLQTMYIIYHRHYKVTSRRHRKLKIINGVINTITAGSILLMSGHAVFLPPIKAAGNGLVVTLRMAAEKLRLGEKEAELKLTLEIKKSLLSSLKMRLRSSGDVAMSQSEKDAFTVQAKGIDMTVEITKSEHRWYYGKYEVPTPNMGTTMWMVVAIGSEVRWFFLRILKRIKLLTKREGCIINISTIETVRGGNTITGSFSYILNVESELVPQHRSVLSLLGGVV